MTSHRHSLLSDVESTSVQEIVREKVPCTCALKCKRIGGQCELENSSAEFVANPATFVHGDNRTSFLYTFQQFLHICLILVPITDVITKVTMARERLQGYVIVNDAGTFLTWMVAIFVLRTESARYFKAGISRHSLGLLLFWALAFIIENLSFISWNNPYWWFGRNTSIQKAEFGLFVVRYTIIVPVFLLGLKGPGLYQLPSLQFPIKEEPLLIAGSSVREFCSLVINYTII